MLLPSVCSLILIDEIKCCDLVQVIEFPIIHFDKWRNFSASMGVTPAVAVSPFVEMEYWEFNHLYEIAALDFVDQD